MYPVMVSDKAIIDRKPYASQCRYNTCIILPAAGMRVFCYLLSSICTILILMADAGAWQYPGSVCETAGFCRDQTAAVTCLTLLKESRMRQQSSPYTAESEHSGRARLPCHAIPHTAGFGSLLHPFKTLTSRPVCRVP